MHRFSPDGKKMYVSIGSRSNVSDNAAEENRARIFEFNPDGSGQKVYAWGIRNAVGIAFRPGTNELWMSTNERNEIGEDLPPDHISSVRPAQFTAGRGITSEIIRIPATRESIPSSPIKSSCPMCSWRRTRLRSTYVFIPATNSRPNTKATSSLRSTVHGTE